ncbi:hypothetical protein V6N11_067957 [Hibiscus sabdariffa]|uniref:Uncharacterized protein n=1 Tax=Hibiscus sabdariffa TaxID=183260 RepID=A0ABR2SSY5_9ROSI
MYKDTSTTPARLVMVALAHGLALFAAVASSINVSGGHVNPAVTFGALLGGRISVVRAVYYWVAQLLGAIVACLLLRLTAGMRPAGFTVASGVGELRCMILEIVLTFGLAAGVHGVWNGGGSEKREHGDNSTPGYRVNSGRQHLSRRGV